MHRYWDIALVSILWPWNPGLGSLKVIGTDTYQSATHDFLLTFRSNHQPVLHRFWDRRRYRSKIAKEISHPLYFTPLLKGLSLELGIGARGQKTRVMGLLGRESSFTIPSAIWIKSTNVTNGKTLVDSIGCWCVSELNLNLPCSSFKSKVFLKFFFLLNDTLITLV